MLNYAIWQTTCNSVSEVNYSIFVHLCNDRLRQPMGLGQWYFLFHQLIEIQEGFYNQFIFLFSAKKIQYLHQWKGKWQHTYLNNNLPYLLSVGRHRWSRKSWHRARWIITRRSGKRRRKTVGECIVVLQSNLYQPQLIDKIILSDSTLGKYSIMG